jgi:hypothetical protein
MQFIPHFLHTLVQRIEGHFSVLKAKTFLPRETKIQQSAESRFKETDETPPVSLKDHSSWTLEKITSATLRSATKANLVKSANFNHGDQGHSSVYLANCIKRMQTQFSLFYLQIVASKNNSTLNQ